MRPTGSRSVPAVFPRSLLASASVHVLLVVTGLVWGLATSGGERPGPRVYALRFDEPRPEPFPDARAEPPAEAPRADEREPELCESPAWLVEDPAPPAEPAPRLRAVDWLEERPLEIASLPTRPAVEPEPAPTAPVSPPAPAASERVASAPALERAVVEPAPLDNPPPDYPRLARRAGEEGSVLCRLHLDAAGAVERVEVVESSGSARLDQAARDALARWRFHPRRVGGRAVAASFLHRVTFRLES